LSLGQDLCFTALRNSQGNLVLTLKEVEGKFGEDMLYSFRLRWPTTELRNWTFFLFFFFEDLWQSKIREAKGGLGRKDQKRRAFLFVVWAREREAHRFEMNKYV